MTNETNQTRMQTERDWGAELRNATMDFDARRLSQAPSYDYLDYRYGHLDRDLAGDQDLANRLIRYCEARNLLNDAAEIAKKAGQTERAIQILEKECYFEKAIDYARRAGLADKVNELHVKQVDSFEKYERFEDAADYAREQGLESRANELYEKEIQFNVKKGNLGWAGRVAEKAGQKEKANELYAKASQCYERDGDLEWAADCAKRAGQTERANRLYETQIQTYETSGRVNLAAELAKKAGMTKVIERLSIAKLEKKAQRIAEVLKKKKESYSAV